jgi:serine/threonine protein kinase
MWVGRANTPARWFCGRRVQCKLPSGLRGAILGRVSGSASAEVLAWNGTARYEVLGRLGNGGMGVVFEAFDRERRQLVAVKKLLRYDPAGLYLFKQEFRTLADVRHTNLVHLYELVVDDDGDVFFTMELVRGADFRQHSRLAARAADATSPSSPAARASSPSQPPDRATVRPPAAVSSRLPRSPADLDRLRPALRQLVEGIQALHSAGKLHRDVKPSNILVTPEGRVVILDFGVATELRGHAGEAPTGSGEVVGTARYMAPEQVDENAPIPASDWYSVGVILYEALVGQTPFVGSTIDVLSMKSAVDPLAPSECVEGVPPDLDALCVALLRRDPEARPQGADILRRLGATRTSAPPSALVADPSEAAFVGRETQLQALRAAYAASRATAVTVRVGGASGMGKSTLVHYFLDQLAQGDGAVVLRGRAYERETVPYKAVDTVVDALSRHLMAAEENGEAHPLPPDAWLLARLFPVLQRVPSIAELQPLEVDDPQSVRRRAFAALRDLLATVAASRPLVLFVDDAQWGDVDSAALLLQLLRPPAAPPVLVVMTYRDNEERTSPFLAELRDKWPTGADRRDVEVKPLEVEDALMLAMTLLNASDEFGKRTARAVARESRGSPFLIEELVRSNRGVASAAGATLAILTLDQMVAERLGRLPDAARRVVEIVAVGGRPLPVSAIGVAAQAPDSVNESIGYLSARRFLRSGLRDGRDVVEMTHDRIRETVVAQLPAITLREHHGRLARALQEAPGADAEAVALHWLGAGDTERAARFAEDAAEQAVVKLAFDQAARLFRLALENLPGASPEQGRLRARFAEVLRLAGRSEESARAFLAAADGATPERKLEFQRAAAEQLLFSGRIDEGKQILHRVLDAIGMKAPRTPLAAVFRLLVYRLWLRIVGLRFKERSASEVSAEQRLRVDALSTVAHCFSLVDVIRGACMQARHLIEALRVGDRFQVARALGIEAGHLAAAGGPETERERTLVRTAASLAEKEGSPEARAFFAAARGVGLFQRGRWVEAQPLLAEAARHASVFGGLEMSRLFDIYNRSWMGQWHDACDRKNKACALAEDRGDLFTLVNMRTSLGVQDAIRTGDPERARRDLDLSMAQWSQSGFHVQHWQAMVYGAELDTYAGDHERAYRCFVDRMPALKKSLLLHAGFIRTMTWFSVARLGLASIAAAPGTKDARIAEARGMARKLRREADRWAGALAALVEASVENAAGRRDAAIASLRATIEAMEATHTLIYAEPVRHRLGELLGGEEGRALIEASRASLVAQGFVAPERWVSVIVPGHWSAQK